MATKTRQLADFLVAGGVSDAEIQSVPHIKPGILQPAIAGKLLDSTTSHGSNGSTAYGTTQADGHKYYYTEIKGSQPIKDPRIGAYFGSQRHKFKSLQQTYRADATHSKVCTVDGRDWIRLSQGAGLVNDTQGNLLTFSTGFMEITGYFSDFNLIMYVYTSERGFKIHLDGTALESGAENTFWEETLESPMRDRYLEVGAVGKITTGATLGIHTMKIAPNASSDNIQVYGCELIAQDTGTSTRKNHVNIPAQNVVSYGKKFSIGSDTLTNAVHKHWNPFAFKTDGSTAWASGAHNGTSWPVGTGSSHNIDTATSLGLEKWKHSDNYYKPYNGGRVVIWVANDGTIKTSVTVMPPNAKSSGDSASLTNATAKANASIANNTYYPTFEAHTSHQDEDGLSEVAKVFHHREFGNGGANQGAGGSIADFSVNNATNDTLAYMMDDGLTGMSTYNWQTHISGTHDTSLLAGAATTYCHGSFIGTGITINFSTDSTGADAVETIAQNLPYGSHIWNIKYHTAGSNDFFLDGIHIRNDLADTYVRIKNDITFHQPKKPPIPEDACIIADYMLMADFVVQGDGNTAATTRISKGVRIQTHTRDVHYSGPHGITKNYFDDGAFPGMGYAQSDGTTSNAENNKWSLQAFGTTFLVEGFTSGAKNDCFIDDSDVAQNTNSTSGSAHGAIATPNAEVELGSHKFAAHGLAGTAGSPYLSRNGFMIRTPIHTSHHYQAFETPYLHELIGGDRNMEQTNLIVTPDGKTWDQVVRDTSYQGDSVMQVRHNAGWENNMIWNRLRGRWNKMDVYNKDSWCYGHDRFICLKSGLYQIDCHCLIKDSAGLQIHINGVLTIELHPPNETGRHEMVGSSFYYYFNRHDRVQISVQRHGSSYSDFQIHKTRQVE